MENAKQLKDQVRQKYGEIAFQDKATNQSSCCGSGNCSTELYNIMTEDYSGLPGYNQEADLGLGCGLPTQFANIHEGDVVVDLGSGAGNDCFVARTAAGARGRVIGIDFTPAMIRKARENAEKLGYQNVEFREGDIEELPLADGIADVIVSNCVLNLVPDKDAAFAEIYRTLKPGGHFSISDVVLVGRLPDSIRNAAEMYVGCVAGAIQKEVYLENIRNKGFENIRIQKEKPIEIPDDILRTYLSPDELDQMKQSRTGIFSITVYAEKPAREACCGAGCCD